MGVDCVTCKRGKNTGSSEAVKQVAGDLADKTGTLLAHCRRLLPDAQWARIASSVTEEERQALH